MSNTQSLLPCPFCGGDAHIVDDLVVALVECGLCGATAATRSYHAGAIEAWNRRTPQPVHLGFTIENRAGIDVLVWQEGGCRPATSAEVAMWKALSAVQQPVVREPLTDERLYEEKHNAVPQLFDLARDWADNKIHSYQFAHEAERIVNVFARRVEAAHGITQKGGSNAE